jgi:hypothetical protein
MLENRVTDSMLTVNAYNQLLERYIMDVFACKEYGHESKSKQIPLYIACMLGQNQQCEVYSKLLLQVTDEVAMK